MTRHQLTLNRKRAFTNTRSFDDFRINRGEATEIPFRYVLGSGDRGVVCGLDEPFGDYVDCTFARRENVRRGVFNALGAREADGKNGGVVVDNLGVGEGSEVALAVWGDGGNEANLPGVSEGPHTILLRCSRVHTGRGMIPEIKSL